MCLRYRANHWKHLAQRELLQAPRTWFVTLTLAPHNHFFAEQRARIKLNDQGVEYDKLKELEKFYERDRAIYPDIQKFFKRLRKETKSSFRYLLCGEIHTEKQKGYPHYHILLHEREGFGLLKKRAIQGEWHLGFSQCKLVEENNPHAHWYVTKYLTKEASTRVRASFRYGHGPTLSKHKNNRPEGGKGKPKAKLWVSPYINVETDYSVEGTTVPLFLKDARASRIVTDIRDTLGPAPGPAPKRKKRG